MSLKDIFRFWLSIDQQVHRSIEPPRIEKELVFRYTAPGGGTASVPRIVKPYQVLQVDQHASKGDFKAAFRRDANHSRRQDRVMASLSYNILMSSVQRYRKKSDDSYEVIGSDDVFVLAAVGDTASLLAQISKNTSLVTSTDEHNHTLLYLTARAGFYDTTKALLEKGVPMNVKQVDGSTALHAASFYGQRPVVELLLRYGADPTIKNKWDATPADEAASTEIKQVILSYKEDRVCQLTSSLIGKGLASRVHFIERNGVVVAKEVFRHDNAFDEQTRYSLNLITSNWIKVWHGTKANCIESILRHGLKPSGSKLPNGSIIRPPEGHISQGQTLFDINNWADAMFLSPSVAYASDIAYSERIFSGDREQWCILIGAYVKPCTYTQHRFTTSNYQPFAGEPEAPEFRIKVNKPDDEIYRVEVASNVVVRSIVFISLKFLEDTPNVNFAEMKSLFET